MAEAQLWIFEPLGKRHDRAKFDCGVPVLNEWLAQRAGQFDRKDLARTYVAIRPHETTVLGYFALSSHAVQFESLPADQAKGLPRLDIPVALIGRLAVDRQVQGQGLGAELLMDAFRRIHQLAEQIGIKAVEVDAIDDSAKRFYKKHGFVDLLDDPHHLFLPMRVLRALKLPPVNR
jgi:GNAT superfamily N-acetyltransferase